MDAMARVYSAVTAAGFEVAQRPAEGSGTEYVSFFIVSGRGYSASNGLRRLRTMIQVDLWSRVAPMESLKRLLAALGGAGIALRDWGPEIYETDSRWHHVPITVEVGETA